MKKRIGILYLCTGPYKAFWDDYYNSFEKNFIRDIDKHYFVYSDSFEGELEKYIDNPNVTLIHIDAMPWPLITLLRFKYFLMMEEDLKQFDYLMFTNANIICNQMVERDEFLPNEEKGEKMSFCQHPGYWKTPIFNVPFDRCKKSNAYIPYNCGENYVIGAMFAGCTDEFLNMTHILKKRIEEDLKHNIIAKWHDESHLNRYIVGKKNYKLLSPSFCYPVGIDLKVEKKICAVSKQEKFDVNTFKGMDKYSNTLSDTFKRILKRIRREGFAFYIIDKFLRKKIEVI